MSERKSSRSRKVVDYSNFSREADSDDDFAEPTPPPAKKQRTGKESKIKDSKKSKVKETTSREKRRLDRIPAEETEFEQSLQLALAMSQIDSQGSAPSFTESQEAGPPVIEKHDAQPQGEEPVVIDSQESDPPMIDREMTGLDSESSEDVGPTKLTVQAEINPLLQDNKENQPKRNVRLAKKITSPVQETDSIVVLEENVSSSPKRGRGQRRAANKASSHLNVSSDSESNTEDEEFKLTGQDPPSDTDSEDGFSPDDDDDDSDFGETKSKNKSETKGKTPKKKSMAKTSTPKPTMAVSKTAKKGKSESSISNSTSKSPVLAVGVRGAVGMTKSPASTVGVRGVAGMTKSPVSAVGIQGAAGMTKSPCIRTAPVSKSPSITAELTVKSPLVGAKPTIRSPALSASRKPTWTPPGATGVKSTLGGVTVKSPGGTVGVLRPGLSRNVRLKPLHSSVKVPT